VDPDPDSDPQHCFKEHVFVNFTLCSTVTLTEREREREYELQRDSSI
jgi:hypothetical protein